MTEIRDLLRGAADGFEPSTDLLERARRRSARRRSNRRLVAGSLAVVVFGLALWALLGVFSGPRQGRPAGAVCARIWESSDAPAFGTEGGLSSVAAIGPDEVWAVGPGRDAVDRFGTQDWKPVVANRGARGWRAVSVPEPPGAARSELAAVAAIAPDDVWAVGDWDTGTLSAEHRAIVHVLIEHWDGSTWSVVPAPDLSPDGENRLLGVAAGSPDDVWAVGFGTRANLGIPLIEHWDGSTWSLVTSPDVTEPNTGALLEAVAVVGPDDVWAVGSQGPGTLVEHWDGSRWEVIPSPSRDDDSELRSVTATSGDDVWAVGAHFSSGGSPSSGSSTTVLPGGTLMEHWDGHEWSLVSGADVPDQANQLWTVTAAAPNDVWAVGLHRPTGDVKHSSSSTLLEHWDGSSWRILPSPDKAVRAELLGVTALPTGEVWAVGSQAESQDANGYLSGVTPIVDAGRCAS